MKAVKSVVVFAAPELVSRLRERVPNIEFNSSEEATGEELLAIVEDGRVVPPPSARLVVQLQDSVTEGQTPRVVVPVETLVSEARTWMSCFDALVDGQIQRERLEEKLEISRSIEDLLSTRDFDGVFERVATTAARVSGFPTVTLLFYDSDEERYTVSYSNDPVMEDSTEYLPGVPTELLQDAMETESDFGYEPANGGKSGMLVIPLRSDEDAVGLLAHRIPPGESIDASRIARAARYVRGATLLVSTAFHLTRSNELAMKDDLTRAFNRRFFESYLNQEIERSVRYGTIFSIIFLDLDELKKVNDEHGHISGSKTLQEVAKRILGAVRAIDKVVRFGGDEFCIILPQTDEVQAKAVADRVRKAIGSERFTLDEGAEVAITASFGIASVPRHARTKESLIRKADDAMYRIKTGTKNAIGVAAVDE